MKYVVEMDTGAMIYIQKFYKIGSDSKELTRGYTLRHSQQGDLMDLLLFFRNKESRLKMRNRYFIHC
jgi:hypothetical protein